MNKEKLNNIIIFNSIPSNLIEEAIFILKPADIQNTKKVEEYARLEGKDFVKRYLEEEKMRSKKNKKKIHLISCLGIIILLILSAVHILK